MDEGPAEARATRGRRLVKYIVRSECSSDGNGLSLAMSGQSMEGEDTKTNIYLANCHR